MADKIKQLIKRLNKLDQFTPEAARLRKQLIKLETLTIKRR